MLSDHNAIKIVLSTEYGGGGAFILPADEALGSQLIEAAYLQDSSLQDGFARLGGGYRQIRDWNRAKTVMQRDFYSQRMSSDWQLRYAEVLMESGDKQQCVDIIVKNYSEDKLLKDGYARLGGIFMRRGEWSRALSWFKRDHELGRLSPTWMLHYAVALAHTSALQEAVTQVAMAYDLDEELVDGYSRLGWAVKKSGNWQTALNLIMRDYESRRISPLQMINLAVASAHCGNEHNIPLIQEAYSLSADIKDGYARVGWALYGENHDFLSFISLAEKDFHTNRLSAVWQVQLARAYRRMCDLDRSISLIEQLLDRDPGYVPALQELVSCLMVRQDWKSAQQALLRMWKTSKDTSNYAHIMIAVRSVGDHKTMAQTALDMAKRCTPDFDIAPWIQAYDWFTVKSLKEADDNILMHLSMMAVEHNKPPTEWWLSLYFFCFCAGRLALAFKIKDIASRIAADQNPMYIFSPWFKMAALIERQAFDEVIQMLSNDLDGITDKEKREELLANIAMVYYMRGDQETATAMWSQAASGLDNSAAYCRFKEIVCNKSVAIVGGADVGLESGEEIDSFDVVIRTNYLGQSIPDSQKLCIGSSTHISYYANHYARSNINEIRSLSESNLLKASVIHYGQDVCNRLMREQPACITRSHTAYWPFVFSGIMLAAQRIVTDLLPFSPSRIKVFNCDFYLGSKIYNSQHPHFERFERAFPVEALAHHDLLRNVRFARELFYKAHIEADSHLKTILALDDDGFICALKGRHFQV